MREGENLAGHIRGEEKKNWASGGWRSYDRGKTGHRGDGRSWQAGDKFQQVGDGDGDGENRLNEGEKSADKLKGVDFEAGSPGMAEGKRRDLEMEREEIVGE